MTKNNNFPTDTLITLLGLAALFVFCVMHLGFDFLDLAFSARCFQYYLNSTEDGPQLSRFEQVMCILG